MGEDAPPHRHAVVDVDPFDLPDWLGERDVTWVADAGVWTGHRVPGTLVGSTAASLAPSATEPGLVCDLLGVDEAYPVPVADDSTRLRAHQAWRHGEVLLVAYDERLTLAVPGTRFTADLALEALARLARAVGASPCRFAALLRLGTPG